MFRVPSGQSQVVLFTEIGLKSMKAEYIDHMGDDLTVVNAARVSFDKESEWEWEPEIDRLGAHEFTTGHCQRVLKTTDARLILYLVKHNHFTPFTHCVVQIRETVPIFVARQRFKHVVGFSYNEVSRRYVDSEPEFYEPEAWRKRAENKKQGSSEEVLEGGKYRMFAVDFDSEPVYYSEFIDICRSMYHAMLAEGVCPEQARMVLPQSMLTSYYVTGSLAAWARAYKLRIDPHSQYEIQLLAREWDKVIRPLFPASWSALVD
jgi:thymidylate synthase (FAD)